jgi:hypothetical protein
MFAFSGGECGVTLPIEGADGVNTFVERPGSGRFEPSSAGQAAASRLLAGGSSSHIRASK